MEKRTSSIGEVRLVELGTTSVFEIGDSVEIKPASLAIAIQRERAVFLVNELHFEDFTLFSIPIPEPLDYEPVEMIRINESPIIQIGHLDIFNAGSSSVIHLGSSESLQSSSRIKHIRHLFQKPQRPPQGI